jgi:hypothetical protein
MAEEYYCQDKGSWLKRAIISPSKTKVRCKHAKTLKIKSHLKKALLNTFSPVGHNGLGGIRTLDRSVKSRLLHLAELQAQNKRDA